MTDNSRETRDANYDSAFPDVIDDASPERSSVPEPQSVALPGDDYLGANAVGTTSDEQAEGESLTSKLSRENPDTDAVAVGSDRDLDEETRLLSDPEGRLPGRLVDPDEGAHTDIDAEVIATEVFSGEDDLSPEELAMHIEQG